MRLIITEKESCPRKKSSPFPLPHPPHSLAQSLPEEGHAALAQLRGKSVAGPRRAESG